MGLFKKEQDRYKNYDYRYNRPSMFGGFAFFPPVIKYLLVSNILIFLFQFFLFPSFRTGNQSLASSFMKLFALNPIGSTVFPFYPWQLFTYMFMHAGFWHLFMNMFALWMFGMELENIWGSKKFLTYYMICGLGAGLANLFISPIFTDINVPTVGASGAIIGVLVAFGLMFPDRPIFLYFLFPIKAKYFVLIYMFIELLSVGSAGNIAHIAHLGGGVVGFIYLLLTNSDISNLLRFDKSPKIKTGSSSNVYRNKYYEKYNDTGSDDISDADYYEDKENGVSQEKIDEILDKISKEGYKNLTEEEKRILFEASKKIH
jgi:membrane associated rhomboid family serine protease